MAQITTGFRSVFSHPAIYNLSQRMVGAEKARRTLVNDCFPSMHGMRMLDIGCGTAEILRHLPEDITYYGFDISDKYINEAKQEFNRRGTFKAEKLNRTTVDALAPFDIVLAVGLLHHLADAEVKTLFELACNAMAPTGRFISMDPVYLPQQNFLARWLISRDRGQCVRTKEGYVKLAKSQFDTVSVTVRHDMLRIPYSHLIMECRKRAL